jgi:hypothetical protein
MNEPEYAFEFLRSKSRNCKRARAAHETTKIDIAGEYA